MQIKFLNNVPYPIVGVYSISTKITGDVLNIILYINQTSVTFNIFTLGPCAGNGLNNLHQKVWSFMYYDLTDLSGVTLNTTITRVYQNASLPLQIPQWILLGTGIKSYYAISVPHNSNNLFLQIELRRHNSSFPSPSKFFKYVAIATDQKCLNPSSNNNNKPGVVERLMVNETENEDFFSHVFGSSLPSDSVVYLDLSPAQNESGPQFDFKYSITASFVNGPSPPTPTPPMDNPIDVFGVVCGVLIFVGVVGVGISVYYKKKKREYRKIQNS